MTIGPDRDPYLWLTDPILFVSDLQDSNKKIIIFLNFFAFYFLKVHLHQSYKMQSHKEATKQ